MTIKTMKLTLKKRFEKEPIMHDCIGFRTSYLPDGLSVEIYGIDSAGYMDVVAMYTGIDSFSLEKDTQ